VPVNVVRNVPEKWDDFTLKNRSELGLPDSVSIVLLQGAFLDKDRGCIEAVKSMQWVTDAVLVVIGEGDEKIISEQLAQELNLGDKVMFFDKMPFAELCHFTSHASLGLSLDKPNHLNYKLSLPNKLFDYIRAGVPVLTSDLPELRKIHEQYYIGLMVSDHEPQLIAERINEALKSEHYNTWKENVRRASEEISWENESAVIRRIYQQV
jgi:glycosyltransferase involved in cell wall biosynthesis